MNKKTIFVRPREGIRLLMPNSTNFLPIGGALVEDSPFWRRRLRDGDAILVTAKVVTPNQKTNNEVKE